MAIILTTVDYNFDLRGQSQAIKIDIDYRRHPFLEFGLNCRAARDLDDIPFLPGLFLVFFLGLLSVSLLPFENPSINRTVFIFAFLKKGQKKSLPTVASSASNCPNLPAQGTCRFLVCLPKITFTESSISLFPTPSPIPPPPPLQLSSRPFLVPAPPLPPSKLISLGWIEIDEFGFFLLAQNLLELPFGDFDP